MAMSTHLYSAALILFVAHELVAQTNSEATRPLWRSLTCYAQATKDINLGDESSSPNSDLMKIVRNETYLNVTVNGAEFKKIFGSASATDTYRIEGFGVRSLSAIHSVVQDSILHTLIIDNDGKQAL
jgi:hypothetical protein